MSDDPDKYVVGVAPWLPWPLSAWAWWTEPVRAERLAAWRVGVALCVIIDLLVNYLPWTIAYYGKGGLGDPANFDWRFQAHRTTWSLLRGVGDPANFYLSLTIWIAATFWILGNSLSTLLLCRSKPVTPDRTGAALWIWSAAYLFHVAGHWANMLSIDKFDSLAWVMPLVGFSLACLFHAFDIGIRLRDESHRIPWFALVFTLVLATTLTLIGFALAWMGAADKDAWWTPLLRSWQENDTVLLTAMFALLGVAGLLLVGISTRFAAVMTWMLSMSFANANPYLDNAGDTIRGILLFYLMLCPCGAVWSIDALLTRPARPVFVHPWPIRLMFVQMIFIYFMNGIYKLMGENWIDGSSLHYVLGDLVLTRVSPSMWPTLGVVGQLMTWTVLVWEVSFPILVVWKWSRRAALVFGVMFHLGIFATMELGGFVPYAICMYLPLMAWEVFGRSPEAQQA